MSTKKTILVFFIGFLFLNKIFAQSNVVNEGLLAEQWDLYKNEDQKNSLFTLKPYKPVYALFAKFTNDVNEMPFSPNPERTASEAIPYDATELKFQISVKTKILNNVFGPKTGGDFWLTYTQLSFWQMYNVDLSRPFRENNYEPELIFILPVRYRFLGLNGVYIGAGLTHQSNGRSNPYSRSWNRIVAHLAWEGKNTSIVFKPWWRLPEDDAENDNIDMEDYIGRAELQTAWSKGAHELSCRARHSLRFGEDNRGSFQLDYSFRILNNLRFHSQLFTGYGESMIDYNHKQTTFGFGLSLSSWR